MSVTPQVMAGALGMVDRARAEVASLRQIAERLRDDPSPQSQRTVADLNTRIQHAEGLLAKADQSVKNVRAAGRVPPKASVTVPKSVRAQRALAVLLTSSYCSRKETNLDAIQSKKRPAEGHPGAALEPPTVKPKTEPIESPLVGIGAPGNASASKAASAKPVDLDSIFTSSSQGLDAPSGAKDAAPKGGEASATPKQTPSDSNAAVAGAAGNIPILSRTRLRAEILNPVLALSAKTTGLQISAIGPLSVLVTCPNVFQAVIWLTTSGNSVAARTIGQSIEANSDDAPTLYPDYVVVCGAGESVPTRWGSSKFAIFQLLGDRARTASRFFWTQHSCTVRSFVSFCNWLAAHKDLFSQPLEERPDKRRLAFDASRGFYLPACIRPFSAPSEVRFPRGSIPPHTATRTR